MVLNSGWISKQYAIMLTSHFAYYISLYPTCILFHRQWNLQKRGPKVASEFGNRSWRPPIWHCPLYIKVCCKSLIRNILFQIHSIPISELCWFPRPRFCRISVIPKIIFSSFIIKVCEVGPVGITLDLPHTTDEALQFMSRVPTSNLSAEWIFLVRQ